MFHYDSVLLIWASILLFMTYKGLASSFFLLINVFFPLLRDFIIFLLGKLHFISGYLIFLIISKFFFSCNAKNCVIYSMFMYDSSFNIC